jgi:Pilus formation protein N terminal region
MSRQTLRFTLVASVLACFAFGIPRGWTFEQVEVNPPPEQVLDLVVGVSRLISTATPFSAVDIADPNVVDAKPETDRSILLVPKASGETTIYFFDQKKTVLSSFVVRIAPSASPELQPGSIRPNYMQVPGRIKLHNMSSLGGITYYQCSATNCELVQVAPLRAEPSTETKQISLTKEVPGGTTSTTTTTTEHVPH